MSNTYSIDLSQRDLRALDTFAKLATPLFLSPAQALDTVRNVMEAMIDDMRGGYQHVLTTPTPVDGIVENTQPVPLAEAFAEEALKCFTDPATERVTVCFAGKKAWEAIADTMACLHGVRIDNEPSKSRMGATVGASIHYVAALAQVMGPHTAEEAAVEGGPTRALRTLSIRQVDSEGKQTGPMMGRHITGLNF